MKQAIENHVIAEAMRSVGGRAAAVRTQVSALRRAASFPLSHSEIAPMLAQDVQRIDRVTASRL